MSTRIELMFSPAEFATLSQRDLSQTVCVVFDVLRATSSMITALDHGAVAIIPVSDISEALAIRQKQPHVLLAGERQGVRIRAPLTGSIDFDLGNSPREFTADKVKGKTIVMTTTNGTRALRACQGASATLIASFLNLRATIQWLQDHAPAHLVLVCSGTYEEAALEDTLAAGALCDSLWSHYSNGQVSDSVQITRQLYLSFEGRLLETMRLARNARRLLEHPELRDDVPYCLERDTVTFVAGLDPDGSVRRQL